jgi:hypothetical protein
VKAARLPPAFLLGLFDPEDGGDMFLRNVGCVEFENILGQKWQMNPHLLSSYYSR